MLSRRSAKTSRSRVSTGLLALCAAFLMTASTLEAQIAVRGETVWTMAGNPITNGIVLINDGKITAVGPASSIQVPANYRVIDAKVVTPGLIDARTVVGLNGYLNQPHDQMGLDGGGSFQPELRAIDAYNPEEKLVEWVREFGVTTINTGHQPGALSSGQMMIAKTYGKNIEEVTVLTTSMISVALGGSGIAGQGRSPGTRGKQAAMLRAELIKAQENAKKAEAPTELRAQIMMRVIRGEVPMLVYAERAQDIMTAIRIAKEFNIKIILEGAAEAQSVLDEIKASGFPVILHPTMARAGGERQNLSMETAAKLRAAGIPFALQSGYEGYVPKTRVVLFEAAIAAAQGLGPANALASITIDAARILGIDDRVGSIAVGKEADIAMYDGDPFEYTTRCVGTMIGGRIVSETAR